MNSKVKAIFILLALASLLFMPVAVADRYTYSIRTEYTDDSGWRAKYYPAPYADVYDTHNDYKYLGTTDSRGLLYLSVLDLGAGYHRFDAAVKIGNNYYYGWAINFIDAEPKHYQSTIILRQR